MPFGPESTTDEVLAGINLAGKHAVVTGGNSGIGYETARALGAAGASVLITARDQAKLDDTLARLRADAPNGKFDGVVCELGSLKSVRACAADIVKRLPKIHMLINNAGVMNTPFGHTEDGFETQFGVDHLGHFVLTNLIAPSLVAAAPSRVVNTSSAAHLRSDILWDDVNWGKTPYDKFQAYGQAKTANVLFSVALDKRLAPKGVRVFAVHPGAIPTNLGRFMSKEEIAKAIGRRTSPDAPKSDAPPRPRMSFKSIPQGAATQVWAVTSPELDGKGGIYLSDCQISPPVTPENTNGFAAYAVDPAAAEQLWKISEDMVKQQFTL